MTKEDRDKELKDINQSRIKLGELAGKLGGFVGGEGKVSEAIKKAIDILNKRYKKCKNLQNGLHNDLDVCQDPENCDGINKQKQKLEGYKNMNTNNNDNPKNLLDNLCDGLEKFLGFNSESKGYDGTGIVYSDLDRLCDGVMGFLSGVLEGVKNDEAVKTYDNYMPDENKLEKVLEKLQSKIGTGRKGLVESVGAVKGWLEGYENKVDEKTDKVTKALNDIKENINENTIPSLVGNFYTVDKAVSAFLKVADEKVNSLQGNGEIIKEIDPVLQSKLHPGIDLVAQALNNFKKSFEFKDLQRLNELARSKMSAIVVRVDKIVAAKCTWLQEYLKNRIGSLHGNLELLKLVKFKDLETSVYKNLADAYFKVSHWIDEFDAKYNSDIIGQVTSILESTRLLKENVRQEKEKLNAQVKALGTQIAALKGLERDMKEKIPKTLDEYERGNNIQWFMQDIKTLKDEIVTTMKTHVAAEILTKIQECVKKISGTEGSKGLTQILSGVERYAKLFDKEESEDKSTFKKIVKEWVDDIVRDNGGASGLRSYWMSNVKGRGSYNTGGTDLHNAVSDSIISEISGLIVEAQEKINETRGDDNSIDSNLTAVQMCIEHFVKGLANKISNRVDAIVNEIEQNKTLNIDNSRRGNVYNSDLKSAVKIILISLRSTANHVGLEIAELLETWNLANVEASLGVAKQLETELEEAIIEAVSSDDVPPDLMGTSLKHGVKKIDTQISTPTVTSTFGTLIHDAVEKGIGKLQDAANLIIGHDGSESENTLEGIKTALTKLQTKQPEYDTHAPGGTSDLQKNAESLYSTIEGFLNTKVGKSEGDGEPRDGTVYKDLKTLQDYIRELGEKADDVKKNVSDVFQQLQECIQDAKTLLEKAPQRTQKIMTDLRNEVNLNVKSAFREIEKTAHTLYNERKREELEHLQKIVQTQHNEIEKIIRNDRANGVKGLLSKLTTSLSSKQNDLISKSKQGNELADFAEVVRQWFYMLISAFHYQNEFALYESTIYLPLDTLLSGMLTSRHYDHIFRTNLTAFEKVLSNFHAETFSDSHKAVMWPIKKAFIAFIRQLTYAYVNDYSGQTIDWSKETNPDGKNCAKVFLTILNTLCEDLPYLENKCKEDSKYSWKHKTISEKHDNKENALGCYLKRCGYAVAKDEHSKDGELNFPYRDYKGGKIYQKLNELKFDSGGTIFQHLLDCDSNLNEKGKKIKTKDFNFLDLLDCLLSHVDKYNEVCHYATTFAKRQPCTVYEMLAWCSGLTYNPVYHELQLNGFTSLLDKPKNKGNNGNKDEDEEEEGPTLVDLTALGLDAYPSDITYNSVHDAIAQVTSKCHDILTTIVGTGDAETVYACDYSNNYLALSYPADPAQCFETLIDILRRLLPQLRYLLTKCSTKAEHNGWQNCEYGKDVPTSKSHCNEQSSDKVTSKAACQPTCQANSKVNCQPTSPLMSYLNDCLPGHLPHHVTSIGCKSVCSNCPRGQRGQPCLTPLGFRGFSCRTRTGKQLYDILVTFMGDVDLSRLLCLLPKPPATLPEHFGFALSLVNGWNNPSKYSKTLRNDIDSSISNVSIQLYPNPDNFSNAICNAYRNIHTAYNDKHHLSAYADLSSLAMPTVCTAADVKCAPYLSSLNCDLYYHLAKKNAVLYLSWITYLPWTFWDLLNNLYNAFCSINCQDWGCRGCLRGDKCKKGEHGVIQDVLKPNPTCQCTSIVDCKGVAPTLYQYGFVFGEASTLNDKQSPKKCSDFCSQLKNVLHSEYFKNLFRECDNFLYYIRFPFMTLTLALWLLSLLYLTHIMVIRLDLLHIKSHLHSPSSHRIAAQSLLAAARVNKLNRVFYLQP